MVAVTEISSEIGPSNGHVSPSDSAANGTTSVAPRPRARLGETQIVELPNSDSEGEEEGDRSGDEAGQADADFLSKYPEDTQVSGCSEELGALKSNKQSPLITKLTHIDCLLQELHLQHLKITNPQIQLLNFPRFHSLKRLCLRQNNLTSPLPGDAFEGLEELEELDFYDNRLGSRMEESEIEGCKNIKWVLKICVARSSPMTH